MPDTIPDALHAITHFRCTDVYKDNYMQRTHTFMTAGVGLYDTQKHALTDVYMPTDTCTETGLSSL